jgi:hypothetical protein
MEADKPDVARIAAALSPERFAPYLRTTGGDLHAAVRLYEWNLAVTGAYCFTMANNYNGSLRLPVVFVSDGVPRLVVRRENYDDLLSRDVLAPRVRVDG